MKKNDLRDADGVKIHRNPDVVVDILAIIEHAGAIVFSAEKGFRYFRLSNVLCKKIKELIEADAKVNTNISRGANKVLKPVYSSADTTTIHLSESLRRKSKELFDAMKEESAQYPDMSSEQVKLWMLEALILIADHCDDISSKNPAYTSNALISKFQKLVDENHIKLSLPKDYAALLFVTPNYLNQMTQKVLGKTAGEIIRDRKLQEAKRLLINIDLNISQISNYLNFTDPSHFSKFFKKHTGKSPEDFRRNFLKDET